jgi:predicted ABC-type exoprotein transport system permease subunit
MISEMLFKRRLRYRLHIFKELIALIVDFWVSLYIVIPGLMLAVSSYIQLLHTLPEWYLPTFQSLWPIIIACLVILGIPRTYLARADLIFIFHHKSDFRKLLNLGQIISLVLKSVPVILALMLAYPFYHHLQNTALNTWLWLSLWVLAVKVMVLLINWHLSNHLSSWVYKATMLIVGLAFYCSWLSVAAPFLLHPGLNLWLALNSILWFAFLLLVIRLLPIHNWDKVTAAEENYDLSMMRIFLGYGAHVQVGGRVGKARWGRSRLGIAFHKNSTYTYFFVKYFLRKSSLWMLWGQFYLLAGFLLVQAVPFWFKLVFMIGTLASMAFMMQIEWREHSQDLFLRMLPVRWEDLQHGIAGALRLLLIPLSVLFVFIPIAGNGTWWEGLIGALAILISALAISEYLSLRISVLFNYDQNRE